MAAMTPVTVNVGEAGKELREWLKSRGPWLFVFGCAAVFLFIPQRWAQALGIDQLRDRHRAWLGVAMIVAGVGLLVSFGGTAATAWNHRKRLKALQAACTTCRRRRRRSFPVHPREYEKRNIWTRRMESSRVS